MELNGDNARPEHPLPDEILKMPRNETVCQYCGISYLIHNEIKLLEDRLKVAELELNKYHGMEEREEELKQQLQLTTSCLLDTDNRYGHVFIFCDNKLVLFNSLLVNQHCCYYAFLFCLWKPL